MKRSFWKSATAMLLCGALVCGTLTSCKPKDIETDGAYGANLTDLSVDDRGKASVNAPIPLSGFEDVTSEDGVCAYQMRAELTDTYTVSCDNAVSVRVQADGGDVVEGETSVEVDLEAGQTVLVEVTTAKAAQSVAVEVKGDKYEKRLPYLPNFTVDASTIDLYGDNSKAPAATEISYTKREGGSYIYLNNP
ncbi:MAG: hypothetical protein IKV35_07285, partial [Clostridia bacterium]|nr:hypothetical protein [Clostridia bacterium]